MPTVGIVCYLCGNANKGTMNIYYNLVFPHREESPIRVIIRHRGKLYRKSTGLSTPTKAWNGKKTGNATKDNALRLIRIGLESMLSEVSTEKDISEALERVYNGRWNDEPLALPKVSKTPSFWEYWASWAEKTNPAKRQRKNSMTLIQRLMGTEHNWDDIDSAFCFRLLEKMNDEGYSKNYQGSVIAKVKTVMGEGQKLKYHNNSEFREFKKPSNEADTAYLTKKELDKLWKLELTSTTEKNARDLMIIGCYTGARWEDFSKFSRDNIVDGKFRYIQRKTGERVVLPLSPRLKEALKRNGWESPKMVDAVFNRVIKTVCLKAGINDMVEVRRSKGNSYEHTRVPKYKMVSSHTCRRTMCTLLDQEGVPMREIMTVSGHKNLASLLKYLRKSERDTEEIFGRVDFFK